MFTIVFVCTGNRFRSPLAEAYVRRLTLGLPVTTSSYGTLSREGMPALPEALEIALWSGVSLADHRSRYVNRESLGDIDLLLGFEPAHLHQAVVDAQAPRERSFLLGDFVELLDDRDDGDHHQNVSSHARTLVKRAAQRASHSSGQMTRPMRDPFGASWKVYRQTASDVRDLSISLVEKLFGVADGERLLPFHEKLDRRRKTLWR